MTRDKDSFSWINGETSELENKGSNKLLYTASEKRLIERNLITRQVNQNHIYKPDKANSRVSISITCFYPHFRLYFLNPFRVAVNYFHFYCRQSPVLSAIQKALFYLYISRVKINIQTPNKFHYTIKSYHSTRGNLSNNNSAAPPKFFPNATHIQTNQSTRHSNGKFSLFFPYHWRTFPALLLWMNVFVLNMWCRWWRWCIIGLVCFGN